MADIILSAVAGNTVAGVFAWKLKKPPMCRSAGYATHLLLLLRQLNTPAHVIPAKAGIQACTGCRIKSGMTVLWLLIAGLTSKLR